MKSNYSKAEKISLLGLLLFYLIVGLLSLQLPFFWGDAIVQSSIYAQWYYDHDFTRFFIPVEHNQGHPPFFGIYLAICWKIFGQNLVVSHLAMLPFLIGIAIQFFHIARYFLSGTFLIFALILFAIEPTILAQSTMITSELAIFFLYLLAIRSMLYRQQFWQIIAMSFIILLNIRGMMLVTVIFLGEFILLFLSEKKRGIGFWKAIFKPFLQLIPIYLLPGIIAIGWLFVHYFIEGWVGFNREDMPWQGSFIKVTGLGYLRNFAVFGWRLLDFGRVFMWLVAGILALRLIFNQLKYKTLSFSELLRDKKFNVLLVFLCTFVLVFFPIMTRYTGTLQHRYLLPFIAIFIICVTYLFQYFHEKNIALRYRNVLFSIMVIGLLSGHFWVYPDKVSQGWEASLAYLPYFKMRDKMRDYVNKNNIDKSTITTGSPHKYLLIHSDLKKNDGEYVDIDEVKYDTFPYLIYTNICNDVADSTYDDIHARWILEYELRNRQVRMSLFKNPDL